MNLQPLKFLFLEPFYGGSHRDFADGWRHFSRHEIDLQTLPASFWKWRMRGAALHFIQKNPGFDNYHGLITTGMLGLADLKALAPGKLPATLLYLHENQLTYPLAPNETMDYQFGFTNMTSALAADIILFNSHTHFQSFFKALPRFIKMMPDHQPRWAVEAIKAKAQVAYPGCWFSPALSPREVALPTPPLIIWNHRWEFDKKPDVFFNALDEVLNRGYDFELVLLGENFSRVPREFSAAFQRFGKCLVHQGFVASRTDYYQWLSRGTVAVSTAVQENFGISMIEAIRHGCLPLVPKRLVYPEIIPPEFHALCLYDSPKALVDKLCLLLENPSRFRSERQKLAQEMSRFAWQNQISRFDTLLTQLSGLSK